MSNERKVSITDLAMTDRDWGRLRLEGVFFVKPKMKELTPYEIAKIAREKYEGVQHNRPILKEKI